MQHEARLYNPSNVPKPFTYAIRRPDRSPEGVVAIEGGAAAATIDDPIRTISRRLDSAADALPMSFALDAATRVIFGGERYLHAYLAHQFADQPPQQLRLTARARQFSSFLLLAGRLGPERTFEPSHAVIVKDKDALSIPLLLDQLPTPKAFRDAIVSLSPEQQRFAKAYRRMQLEGSVFGLLLLQLKPQLERLLNLPADSLTKEIALTQVHDAIPHHSTKTALAPPHPTCSNPFYPFYPNHTQPPQPILPRPISCRSMLWHAT